MGSPALKSGVAVQHQRRRPGARGQVGDHAAPATSSATGPTGRRWSSPAARTGRHGLLAQRRGRRPAATQIYGVVHRDRDRQRRPRRASGRVKVKFPWLADDVESCWARVAAPGAGQAATAWSGCRRWATRCSSAFEHGDVSCPFVLGGLWNGQDAIPFDYDGRPRRRHVTCSGFVSRTGHQLTFYESRRQSSIQLLTKGGVDRDHARRDERRAEDHGQGQGRRSSADGDVEIKAGGSMKLEATGQMTIKGATVAIN